MRTRRKLSLRFWLAVLVGGAMVPLLLFAGATLLKISSDSRLANDQKDIDTARALALAMDGEVRSWKAVLIMLADSASLAPGRFGEFYEEARRLAEYHGGRIALTNQEGRQVLNTLFPLGGRLPETPSLGLLTAVLEQRRPVVTDVFMDSASNHYIVSVGVPVIRDGAVRYMLDLAFAPNRLSHLLERQEWPTGWVAAITDRGGRVIARSKEIERRLGKPVFSWLAGALRGAERGVVTGPLEDWRLGQVAFQRMRETPWTVTLSIPVEELSPEERVAKFALAGVLVLVLGVAAAVVVGQRIARPVSRLASATEAVLRGEAVDLGPRSAIRELRELQEALGEASAAVRSYYLERERATIAEETAKLAAASERAIRESEERLRLFIENAPAAIAMFDREMRYLAVSRRWRVEYCLGSREILGQAYHTVCADVSPRWKTVFERGLAGEVVRADEEAFERSDGSVQWLRWEVHPWRLADGQVGGIVLFTVDITAHKRATEELRVSEERLASIIRNAMDAIISLDQDQRIILFNAAAEKIFGCPAADALGKTLDPFIPDRYREAHRRHIHHFGETGTSARSMYTPASLSGVRADGEEFPLEATISQVDVGGRKLYTVIVRDITQRKRAEELARLYAETKELDRIKTELIAKVSHELRTPLTTIQEGVSQLTEGILGPTTPDQQEYLSIVLSDIGRLARIINDLLDVATIEAGRLVLTRERVDIVEVVRHATGLFEPQARGKGLHLRTVLPSARVEVSADRDKVVQVLANLLANALKFTDEGEVELGVAELEDSVSITVRDTGRGIAEDEQPKIFQKFYQAGRIRGPGEKGTGLGLPIAKAFVEAHGGAISVTSEPGVGSTFTVVLPKS